jgi:hypothetical protein
MAEGEVKRGEWCFGGDRRCSVQRFGSVWEVSANWERKKSFKMRLALHPVLRWRFTRGYGNWPC